jgi:protein TonB
MRTIAAVQQRGWVRRRVARSGAMVVAVIGHFAVLFALAREPASELIVDEPPAANNVEVVFAPPDNTMATPLPTAATDEQGRTEAPNPVQTTTTVEQPEPNPRLAAFAVLATAPISVPERSVSTAKAVKPQAPHASRNRTPSHPHPVSTPSDPLQSTVAESTRSVGADTEPVNVPSAWKEKLMIHLDHYKRYPDAARARRAEGTALLRFGMDHDGRVLRYDIVRSSGYPELDDEALAMIERASPLPPAPPEIREQIVQLVVPIRFNM